MKEIRKGKKWNLSQGKEQLIIDSRQREKKKSYKSWRQRKDHMSVDLEWKWRNVDEKKRQRAVSWNAFNEMKTWKLKQRDEMKTIPETTLG